MGPHFGCSTAAITHHQHICLRKSKASLDINPWADLVQVFDPRYLLGQKITLDQKLGQILPKDSNPM
jgi:hypothetical protein